MDPFSRIGVTAAATLLLPDFRIFLGAETRTRLVQIYNSWDVSTMIKTIATDNLPRGAPELTEEICDAVAILYDIEDRIYLRVSSSTRDIAPVDNVIRSTSTTKVIETLSESTARTTLLRQGLFRC